tara:strand:+ start:92 stop:517 length:426 start_codon:yes stop_codon:yes gene_type:complete
MCDNPDCPNCKESLRKNKQAGLIYTQDPTTIDGLEPNQIEASRIFYYIIKDQLDQAEEYYYEFKDHELSIVIFENDHSKVEQMFEEIKCNTIDIFEFSPFYERFNNFIYTLNRFSKFGTDMYFNLPRYILLDEIRSYKSPA